MSNLPTILKGIMATAGAAVMALQPIYGSQHWFEALIGGLGVLGVSISETHAPGSTGGSGSAS